MSKKSRDNIENGYKSDSYASASKSEFDKPRRFSKSPKDEVAEDKHIQYCVNRNNKTKEAFKSETNELHTSSGTGLADLSDTLKLLKAKLNSLNLVDFKGETEENLCSKSVLPEKHTEHNLSDKETNTNANSFEKANDALRAYKQSTSSIQSQQNYTERDNQPLSTQSDHDNDINKNRFSKQTEQNINTHSLDGSSYTKVSIVKQTPSTSSIIIHNVENPSSSCIHRINATEMLYTNLPCSIEPNYPRHSISKSSITTIDTFKRYQKLYKKRNKVASLSTSTSSSSTSKRNSKEKFNQVLSKDNEGTPDLSSGSMSSVSAYISTCKSNSSSDISEENVNATKTLQNLRDPVRESSIISPPSPVTVSMNLFCPVYSSSLDVPRKDNDQIEFPEITKITSVISYTGKPNYKSTKQNTYSNVEKKIKTDSRYSARNSVNKKHNTVLHTRYSISQNKKSKRLKTLKVNPTYKAHDELLIYSVSSASLSSDEEYNKIKKSDFLSNVDGEVEQTKCNCLCNWMFSKKKDRFFS